MESCSSDPTQMSINVVNATVNDDYVYNNMVRGCNTSAGHFEISWPAVIPNTTGGYQLIFLSYSTGAYVARSETFTLIIPPGEVRNVTGGTAPASPGTSATSTSTESSGLSTGAIAAIAVVVPVVVIAVAVGFFFFLRRRKPKQQSQEEPRPHNDKSELDGGNGKRALPDKKVAPQELPSSKSQLAGELRGDDALKWELPSTPPAPPVELPAGEVAIPELENVSSMGSPPPTYSSPVSGARLSASRSQPDDMTSISATTDHQLPPASGTYYAKATSSPETTTSPAAQQDGTSILSPTRSQKAAQSTHASTTGRSRFAEALYDLVSDELRRPEP